MRTLIAGLLLVGSPLAAQTPTPEQIRRIDSVFVGLDGTDRPGCSVGVGRLGHPVYLKGYGMSDLQQGTPITTESIFHVASVSKQFTAFAVALLAEDGKLSLDDPVRKYVPELPEYEAPITLRHLIYHTSGIRDQWELLGLAGWRYPADLFTQTDVLDIVVRQRELNFRPGDEWVYSNSGYTLLAIVVERVSGQSLRKFADQRIFRPLGMTRTHVHDDHTMIVAGRTSAFEQGPDGWRISIPQFDTHGATSLFTTPADLLKWQHNFEARVVGSPATLAEAERSALLNNGKPANYGFGISTEVYRGAPAFGHGGADAGYRADIVRFPTHGLDIAVACNFAAAVPNRLSRAVADVLIGDQLERRPPAPVTTAGVVSADRLAQVAGVYKAPATDNAYRFIVRDGKLVLDNFGMTLEPVDQSKFSVAGITAEFVGPTGREPTFVRIVRGRSVLDSMARMAPFDPPATARAGYAGEYWSDELRVSYRVDLSEVGLLLRPFKRDSVELQPAFEDAFTAGQLGVVRFVRARGRVTGFRVTGGRVRNVLFAKKNSRP